MSMLGTPEKRNSLQYCLDLSGRNSLSIGCEQVVTALELSRNG